MYLLDTNVLSELKKTRANRADSNVVAWVNAIPINRLFLSVISAFEIEKGILLMARKDQQQAENLRIWFNETILPQFLHRIFPIDLPISRCCAQFHVPDPRPIRDSLIAATAVVHGLTVVTRNVKDFTGLPDVCVLDPWKAD